MGRGQTAEKEAETVEWSRTECPRQERRVLRQDALMVPLIYSPRYNITAFGLEKLHPFDSRKYGRIHDWLVRQGLRKPADFIKPKPVSRADLLRVHALDLDAFFTLTLTFHRYSSTSEMSRPSPSLGPILPYFALGHFSLISCFVP